jgi:hypothetical protein
MWFFLFRGLLKFIFWPPSVRFDWEFNLTYENKEFADFCRQQTTQRLAQTDAQIALFSKEFDHEIIRKGAIAFAQYPYEAWEWHWSGKFIAVGFTTTVTQQVYKLYPHLGKAYGVASSERQLAFMVMRMNENKLDRAQAFASATAFYETPIGAIRDDDLAEAQYSIVQRIYGGAVQAGRHNVAVGDLNIEVVDQRIMLNRCILRMEKPNMEDWVEQ